MTNVTATHAQSQYDHIVAGAAARGYSVHESVTPERLARVVGTTAPTMLDAQSAQHLVAGRAQVNDWINAHMHVLACGDDVEVGDEVVCIPRIDHALASVVLPSYVVVAVVRGTIERTDGQDVSHYDGRYAILR